MFERHRRSGGRERPAVRIITTETAGGEVLARRREYAYPPDDEAGVPGYTDSLDLLGEWEGASVKKLDAEMAARYGRFVALILDPPEPEPVVPVDPAEQQAALEAAVTAAQTFLDAITALHPQE